MIVRDEEPVLRRCLEAAARFADELIVVDTGSTDSTKKIAGAYTQSVCDFPWRDDFAAARNYAYSLAACDYIMWLDADDMIDRQGIRDILRLKEELTDETDVVTFLYGSPPDEQNLRLNDFVLRDRLIKRSLNAAWRYPVHEAIPILPEYHVLDAPHIVVHHRKEKVNDENRNMRILKGMTENGTPLDPFNRYYYCRELHFAGRYEESLAEYLRIRDSGQAGPILDALPYAVWGLKDQGRHGEAFQMLLDSLRHAAPDEFVCCELGGSFLREKCYGLAKYWLEQALQIMVDYRDHRPHFLAYHEFLPCLQLGVLYGRQGDWENARRYNERALGVFPHNAAARMNRIYYQKQAFCQNS
jgi:glycosyltransferase involved in cell wall biosynthesis